MIKQVSGKQRKVLQMRSSAITGRTTLVKRVLLIYVPSSWDQEVKKNMRCTSKYHQKKSLTQKLCCAFMRLPPRVVPSTAHERDVDKGRFIYTTTRTLKSLTRRNEQSAGYISMTQQTPPKHWKTKVEFSVKDNWPLETRLGSPNHFSQVSCC